jgi:hypothetical protein
LPIFNKEDMDQPFKQVNLYPICMYIYLHPSIYIHLFWMTYIDAPGWNIGPKELQSIKSTTPNSDEEIWKMNSALILILISNKNWSLWRLAWLILLAYLSKHLKMSLMRIFPIDLSHKWQLHSRKGWENKVKIPNTI